MGGFIGISHATLPSGWKKTSPVKTAANGNAKNSARL